jgi:tRNA(fMet)-specific endonuclease VapC
MLLLDTNIFMYMSRGKELGNFLLHNAKLATRRDLATSVVCVAEMNSIIAANKWGEERIDEFENYLKQLTIIDIAYPSSIVTQYVAIDGATRHATLGKNDLWVAATASAFGMTLVTADRDYGAIPKEMLNVWHFEVKNPAGWTTDPVL